MLKGDNPEAKLPALRHFPHADLYDMSVMKGMVEKVGDDAWWLHHVIGPWDMAAEVRGLVDLSMDVYDRPQFVHDLMRVCTDWLKPFYRRLGETGIHSISMNETWVGVGVSLEHFREFMKPYEEECVQAAHEAGYMVSFHNCGRATLLLEDIADTGPDAIETLTSNRSSGDVDLADAKRRIGDRVCLFGGFNEHLLHEGDEDDRARGGQALPRRRDGRRRLRAALDRADLQREAGADRRGGRDGPRVRPVQLTPDRHASPSPADEDLYRVETSAPGPPGALPLTPELLRDRPSGDVFGLTQNAGMGWRPSEVGRDQVLILSTQGGIRDEDGTPIALGLPHGALGGRPADAGGRRGARAPAARCRSRATSRTRATAAARARPACTTRCRTATTPRSCCAGSSAACRGARR